MSDRRMLDSFEQRRLCLAVELTVFGVTRCIILSKKKKKKKESLVRVFSAA